MKLKGLSSRLYNITFHTHTVSGIVISFALYVIFFTGAVTLFKNEFYQWENPKARQPAGQSVDYDKMLTDLKKKIPGFDLSEDITIRMETHARPLINIYGHLIVPKGEPEEHYNTTYFPITGAFEQEEKTTIGETLYRLHFFDQIPVIGRYISGFVALFFAFAVITGVMIHWQNIRTKYNGFSLKGSIKNIWTNSHTVFGLLGLPFQFMYAITGAYYMLSLLVLAPVVMVFFGGDQNRAFEELLPERFMKTSEISPVTNQNRKISHILERVKAQHGDLDMNYLQIKNYGHEDGIITISLESPKVFAGAGSIALSLKNGKVIQDNLPGNRNYTQSVLPGIARLHFATFGGLMLKAIYFFMALFTCFVIISGVLLWKEARNKKSYTDKQKRFHHRVTMCYLAVCFGLFPAVAMLFIAELMVPDSTDHVFYTRTLFFISWLVFTATGLFIKNEIRITQLYLFLGGTFSLLVPITNGIMTGDWIWVALQKGNQLVAVTDLCWLTTGATALFAGLLTTRKSAPVRDSKTLRQQTTCISANQL
jgi:uncharacterized iron-regulated membrane protein